MAKTAYVSLTILLTFESDEFNCTESEFEKTATETSEAIAEGIFQTTGYLVNDINVEVLDK